MKKPKQFIAITIMLLITGIGGGHVFADTTMVSQPAETVDVVSSATGTVEEGIKFYKKYGILTAEFPYGQDEHWRMEIDEDSTGAVEIIHTGDTGKVWYTGMKADSEIGWVKLNFTLYKGRKVSAEQHVYLLIDGDKITAVSESLHPDGLPLELHE